MNLQGTDDDDAWSPREELILACAVRLHGVQCWQNVAFEVQEVLTHIKFINSPPRIFTPQKCRLKFQHLLLQFQNQELDYMIEELRQRQIEALKAEIQDHDLNIQLIQQHIKKLQGNNEGTDEVKEEKIEADVDGGKPEEGPPVIVEAPSPASEYIREKMMEFLGILRMYENSSLFENRLPAQNTEAYTKTIRQHIDLQMIESRIVNRDDDHQQYHSYEEFFLDLLLVFNNAIVFFPKSSKEHQLARKLQEVVGGVLKKRIRNHVPGRYICFVEAIPPDKLVIIGLPNSQNQPAGKTSKKKKLH